MPNPFNKPTFMDRARGMTGGIEPPMPDSEFGSEGPIVELFIMKMLKQYLQEKQLKERYGENPDPGDFTEQLFDPEDDLMTGKRWFNLKGTPPGRGEYSPVRPWDMREF